MQAFIAMHWGEEFVRLRGVNVDQPGAVPNRKQPEFKHAAVRWRVELPWRLVAGSCLPLACGRTRAAARVAGVLPCQLRAVRHGRRRVGLLLRAAAPRI
jgi:hypothetical protein